MIRTEHQYRVGTARKNELTEALDNFGPSLGHDPASDWKERALRASLLSQLTDLDAELVEYEQLRAGRIAQVTEIESLDELPRKLIQARIVAGITQRELASRLGVREQQIQRYEAEEYAGVGLSRVRDVMAALGVSLSAELSLPPADLQASTLQRRLNDLGLPKKVTLRRLLRGVPADGTEANGSFLKSATRAARVFGTTLEELLSGETALVGHAAAYRTSPVADPVYLDAYAAYAYYIASLLDRACVVERQPISGDPEVIRDALGDTLRTAPLHALLRYCWSHGVPVLPLADEAAFYGACWEMGGGPVLVLKQRTTSAARWAFLLAHEIKHASQSVAERTVIEQDEDLRSWKEQPAEKEADDFAGAVLLGERAEAMARVAVEEASGNVARLKSVIGPVAEAGNVAPDVLAYFLAHRLVRNGISWWGTARSFDLAPDDPWSVARDLVFEHIDLTRIDEIDRSLLMDALAP
jgi:transcriptional regulator with XRE-family HTH domain